MSAEHTLGISRQECASTPVLVFADPRKPSTRTQKPEGNTASLSELVADILNMGKSRIVSIAPDLRHLSSAGSHISDYFARKIDSAYRDSSTTSSAHRLMNEELRCALSDSDGEQYLLKSLLLNEVEEECTRRGLSFVRSCDGILVFTASKTAQKRVSRSLGDFIGRRIGGDGTPHLGLPSPDELSVDGFSFVKTREGYVRHMSKCAEDEFKDIVRRITSRSSAQPTQSRKRDLRCVCARFERKYSCVCDWPEVSLRLSEWIRQRVCALLWKQWKRVRSKVAALSRIGVPFDVSMALASSRRGYWAMAKSDILKKWLSFSVLRRMGFSFLVACASR